MKVTLETDEREEALDMLKAVECKISLDEFRHFLRGIVKYKELNEDQSKLAEEIYDRFLEDMGEFLV